MELYAKFIPKAAQWILDQMNLAGAEGYVVGMSGGIDSAVAASLAVTAVGKERVAPYFIDCGNTAKEYERANLMGMQLWGDKIPYFNMTPHWQLLVRGMDIFSPHNQWQMSPIGVFGNLKSRLRMAFLYYIANAFNWMVLGTSNKTEMELGYFTKYGDGGADVEPLGDVYKTSVQQLALDLDTPVEIREAAPTAGLWNGQTDEGDLGLTYAVIDSILLGQAHYDKEISAKDVVRIKNMQKTSQHKRQMPPIFTYDWEAEAL